MAAQAVEDGIDVICATPHIRPDHNVAIDELADRIAAVQDELDRRAIPVRIAPGGEVSETIALELSDRQLRAVSLGGGGWVLLEPAPGPLGAGLLSAVDELAARGTRAVIAHPERHAAPGFERRLRELADHGALIQWTAEFVAAAADGDIVLECARAGLVDLLGSDSHSSRAGRPVRLSGGVERLRAELCPAGVEWVASRAPRAVLRGAPVVRPPWSARSSPPA